jgi:hypothetical protein
MKMIYAVSEGSYSDYRVSAIFSTKEKAQEFIDTMKKQSDSEYDDYNDIEEYQLDPPVADLLGRGYSVYSVLMLRNGNVERVERTDNGSYDISSAGQSHIWERTKAPAYRGKNVEDVLHMEVWAKDDKAAVKIVNEKRVQMIAMGEWK